MQDHLLPQESRFKSFYSREISVDIAEKYPISTIFDRTKIDKITVSTSLKGSAFSKKRIPQQFLALFLLTSQKPKVTLARKANANLKIREGMPTGLMTTLRGEAMFLFLDKLINTTLPSIRHFEGLSFSDQHKNSNTISFVIRESTSFLEFNEEFEMFNSIGSVSISITFPKRTSFKEALSLVTAFQFPHLD